MMCIIGNAVWLFGAFASLEETGVDRAREVARVLDRALEVVRSIPPSDLVTKYNLFTGIACARAISEDSDGSRLDAIMASNELADLPGQDQGRVRMDILWSLADARVRAGDRKAGARILREFASLAELRPSNYSFRSFREARELATAQARAGDREAALVTADRVVKIAEALPLFHPPQGVRFELPPTRPVALYQAAQTLEAVGEKVMATDARRRGLREARVIPDQAPRAAALAQLVADRSSRGDLAAAREEFDAFLESLAGGDAMTNSGLLMSVALAQAKADVAVALRTAGRIADAIRRADVIRSIARELGEAGKWKDSVVAWRALLEEELVRSGDFALSDLAIAQARSGDREVALTTARQALKEAERVIRVKRPARLAWVMPRLLSGVALALWEAGDREAARATLAQARALADTTKDRQQKEGILQGIAITMAEIEGHDVALVNVTNTSVYPPELLLRLIEEGATARVRAGDVPGAVRLLELVPQGGRRERTITGIAAWIATSTSKLGKSELAIQWAEAQWLPVAKARALICVASVMMDQKPPANP